MRSRSKSLFAAALSIAVLVVPALPVSAAETSNSEFVIIPPDDVFIEDLYAGAIRVVVDGTLDGDLIAFAGEEVVINGVVTGSVFSAAPSLTVNGTVEGSVRATGSDVTVNGEVGRDVVAAAVSVTVGPEADVSGDLLAWAWRVEASGAIGGDLNGSMRTLELEGEIHGDVEVSVGSLEVVGELSVGGDLGYRSASEAEGLSMAQVEGAVVRETPLPPNIRVRALGMLGRFMVVVFLTTAAIAVAYGWPERTRRAVETVGASPFRAWATGAGVFLAPVVAALVGALVFNLAPASAAFPLLAIIAPVVLALFGIALALALVAGIPAVAWGGGVLFRRLDFYGAILVGGLLAGLVWSLPLVGLLVPVVILPLGLGAWVNSRAQPSV